MISSPRASAPCNSIAQAPPRAPLSLQQSVNELNDVVLRGRAETLCVERLHDFLLAQLRGPTPCNPNKDCEPSHIPLGDIPSILADQIAHRQKVLEEIGRMLGAE